MSVLERRCVFCGFHCGLSVHAIVYGSGRWVFRWGAGLSVAPRWFIGQLFYVWDKRLWRRINEFIGNKCIYSGLSKMRFGTKWQWNCDFLVSQSREKSNIHHNSPHHHQHPQANCNVYKWKSVRSKCKSDQEGFGRGTNWCTKWEQPHHHHHHNQSDHNRTNHDHLTI